MYRVHSVRYRYSSKYTVRYVFPQGFTHVSQQQHNSFHSFSHKGSTNTHRGATCHLNTVQPILTRRQHQINMCITFLSLGGVATSMFCVGVMIHCEAIKAHEASNPLCVMNVATQQETKRFSHTIFNPLSHIPISLYECEVQELWPAETHPTHARLPRTLLQDPTPVARNTPHLPCSSSLCSIYKGALYPCSFPPMLKYNHSPYPITCCYVSSAVYKLSPIHILHLLNLCTQPYLPSPLPSSSPNLLCTPAKSAILLYDPLTCCPSLPTCQPPLTHTYTDTHTDELKQNYAVIFMVVSRYVNLDLKYLMEDMTDTITMSWPSASGVRVSRAGEGHL